MKRAGFTFAAEYINVLAKVEFATAREIAVDIRKAQALCLERGWMRARADGRLEITEKGEEELFQYIAKR